MNASELEVAGVLNDLNVGWEYEPRLFVLEEDEEGNPRSGFRPDFFIPTLDLYIEVTTARQANTTKKNRKARLVREKFGAHIELIYRGDFENLQERVLEILATRRSDSESLR